jgi:hypothetical protein
MRLKGKSKFYQGYIFYNKIHLSCLMIANVFRSFKFIRSVTNNNNVKKELFKERN